MNIQSILDTIDTIESYHRTVVEPAHANRDYEHLNLSFRGTWRQHESHERPFDES